MDIRHTDLSQFLFFSPESTPMKIKLVKNKIDNTIPTMYMQKQKL